MTPRIRPRRPCQFKPVAPPILPQLHSRPYAVAAARVTVPAMSIIPEIMPSTPKFHPTQPPAHRRPEIRKTQVLRQYVALLQNTPVMLIFQHSSLLATEFTAIRTVVQAAMRKVDEAQGTHYADHIKLQVVKASLLDAALRLVEFWQPKSRKYIGRTAGASEANFTHSLSERAYQAAFSDKKRRHGLEPLLSGPIAVLSMPWMSPEHLKVVLSLLAPSPQFPAPKRRANPAYHELAVQSGLPKLICLGARIESQVFDLDRVKWVGGIAGGLQGLRAQLVAMLQGVGAGLVHTLNSAGGSIYSTLESRKQMLEKNDGEGANGE